MKQYPMFKVHVVKEDALDRINTVFDSGFINEGEQVFELQNKLKSRLGSDNLVLTNAGTSALTMALKISGAKPGVNVVATPMTCVAGNTPIINCGADIVWADVDSSSGMVTPATIDEKINSETVAVMLVDWAGVPPEIDEIHKICKQRGVKLIQDAAHAFGAEYKNRPIAEFADFTCFSFQAIKHFTCGDGGALVCRDEADFAFAKKLKWFGFDRESAKDERGNWRGQQAGADILDGQVGFKFNMNNISAAIGLGQLNHIDWILERHRANAKIYDEAFADSEFIAPIKRSEGSNPSFWVYTCVLNELAPRRDDVLSSLIEQNIHAGVVHVRNDNYSAFRKYRTELPGLDVFASNQLSLPCGWWLEEVDIIHIIGVLKKVFTS